MRHTSVPMEIPCEFINVTPLNPLISKCQIKVCYVSDKPNRNRSIITKDVAREMANTLPGNPIVGCFNKEINDFEEHSKDIHISNGKLTVTEATKPYGFVDINAKCWFQKFLDDGIDEREYLMTEGYLWTGQYPEAKRIIEHGNNQSMELNEELLDATWTKDHNGKPKFFIINEAVVEKLCILGEEAEPCFEGSTITSFSLNEEFMDEMRSMMAELKEFLNKEKGGAQVFTKYAVKVGDSLWNALYSHIHDKYSIAGVFVDEEEQKYAVLQGKEDSKFSRLNFSYTEEEANFVPAEEMTEIEFSLDGEPQFAASEIEAFEADFKKKDDEEDKKSEEEDKEEKPAESETEDKKEDNSSEKKDEEKSDEEDKDDEDDKKKKKYSLEEIPEYVELASKFSDLESKYNDLVAEKADLESQLQPLKEFKLNAERVAKEDMINKTFYMLSAEDKKDVIDNIDKYSLEDIEAKLSIICVRNKVSFAALEDEGEEQPPTTYNLGGNLFQDDSTPAWVKAVLDTAKTLN